MSIVLEPVGAGLGKMASSEDVLVNVIGKRPENWEVGALTVTESFRTMTGDEAERNRYGEGSVVPIGEWHDCSIESLLTKVDVLDLHHNVVSHFCIDTESRAKATQFIEFARGLHAHELILNLSELGIHIERDIFTSLANRFQLSLEPRFLGLNFNSPRLSTCTIDKSTNTLVGLHIDTWDHGLPDVRRVSRPRMSVNLGPGTRWFLFAPYSLDELLKHQECNDHHGNEFHPNVGKLISQRVLRRVFALRLLPGEGYVASTDALIHESSTRGSSDANINLQFLLQVRSPEDGHEFG